MKKQTSKNNLLILSRKMNETLVIGGYVRIKILSVKGNRVRLGIEAVESTSVRREAIDIKIKSEEEQGDSLINYAQ